MDGSVRRLPMFPLSAVLFPTEAMPLHVFEPRYRQLTEDCLAGEREFGIVLIARGSEVGGGEERLGLGTLAHLEAAMSFPDGRWALVVRGTTRLEVIQWLDDEPYPVALVAELADNPLANDCPELARAKDAVLRVRRVLAELGEGSASTEVTLDDELETVAWQLCALAPLNPLDAYRFLSISDPVERLAGLGEHCHSLADDLGRMLDG